MKQDKLISILQDELAPIEKRIEASNSLSSLGDTRLGVGIGTNGIPIFAWSPVIEAGTIFIGSSANSDIAFENEKPKHEVRHGQFSISLYPVTNTQFSAFINADDGWYSDEWWSGEGISWRQTSEVWQQGNCPGNYPCIYVNWYAAVAFSNWVSSHQDSNDIIRLPNEPEWERACRGTDDRIYPWGNFFDRNKCNSIETGINDLCSVGIFPGGISPSGAYDMVGGTWEWNLSLSLPYPYDDNRDNLNDNGKRVIRGGAYNLDSSGVTCTIRREDPPQHSGNRISFRLVRIINNY